MDTHMAMLPSARQEREAAITGVCAKRKKMSLVLSMLRGNQMPYCPCCQGCDADCA